MKFKSICAVLAIGSLVAVSAGFAAVSPEEAAKLKTTLTPFGAERAGNKEGTIPAWEGGYTKVPPGYRSGDIRPDPFAHEKALFTITSKNMDQYADKLSETTKAWLKKYPDYRLDVYPSHRTAAAPDWVYENTFKNATRAKATNGGVSVEGAYGGIPFPIPKSGFEVMWNHLMAWQGATIAEKSVAYTVTGGGKKVLVSEIYTRMQYPYYFKDVDISKHNGDYWNMLWMLTAPPFKSGEAAMLKDPVDMHGKGRQAWQYLTGQRRVRRAPSLVYDTPNFVNSGFANFDEAFMFIGALDRYEWKLLGKKELYIPYNLNKLTAHKASEVIGDHFMTPEYMRWELHRVWVVDGTLASGKRHVVAHRRYYIDEDSWRAVQADEWDGQGKLWKGLQALCFNAPEIPAVIGSAYMVQNVQTGAWLVETLYTADNPKLQHRMESKLPESFFTPENLAAEGTR
jgi:hypothetical protein